MTQAFWSYFGNVKIARVVSLFVFNNLMGHFLVHENYCWLLLAKIADLFTKKYVVFVFVFVYLYFKGNMCTRRVV